MHSSSSDLNQLDETGIHKHMTCKYTRAPRGKRAFCHQKYRGDNYTLIGAIRAQKMLLVQVFRDGLKARVHIIPDILQTPWVLPQVP